jgi:ribosomal protein S18 acetylase RimI-like enzyme
MIDDDDLGSLETKARLPVRSIPEGSIKIVEAQLDLADHQQAVVALTAAYAAEALGETDPLSAEVLDRLIPGLKQHPTTLIFLAYCDERAIGIATCFVGFSTFAARGLINIHDLAVLPAYRGRGIGKMLLEAVEHLAREREYAKVTLEVQENNRRARHLYHRAGFAPITYDAALGGSLCYSKQL